MPSCGPVNSCTFRFDIRVRYRAIPLRQLMVAQLLEKCEVEFRLQGNAPMILVLDPGFGLALRPYLSEIILDNDQLDTRLLYFTIRLL